MMEYHGDASQRELALGRQSISAAIAERIQNILRRIWSELSRSTHVIVDLTNFNPNVALELGMAHTLGRNTLMVAQGNAVSYLFPSIAKLDVHSYPAWQPQGRSLKDGGQELRRRLSAFLH
jgi:hypothetical protein